MLNDIQNLVSPITGGKASLNWEWRTIDFRKETFRVMVPFYVCEDTKERFTTTDSDGVAMTQLRNQYCHKHGIPFTDEIKSIRNKYGISAIKMSLILGFGENQWRKYEQEDIPSPSNGKMIRSIMNPRVFLDIVESSRSILSEKEYARICAKIKEAMVDSADSIIEKYKKNRIFGSERTAANGYAPLSLIRLKNIIVYMLQNCGDLHCTKLDKLLFYLDFVSYRERGIAMTGLSYRAAEYGPIPERWAKVYCEFDEIQQEARILRNCECNILSCHEKAEETQFSDEELSILKYVCTSFKATSAIDLSILSREEPSWINHYNTGDSIIPFEEAFATKAV